MTELKRWIVVSDPKAGQSPVVNVKLVGAELADLLGLNDEQRRDKVKERILKGLSSTAPGSKPPLEGGIYSKILVKILQDLASSKGMSLSKLIEELKKNNDLYGELIERFSKTITTKIKEREILPLAFVNPKLIEKLNAEHYIITFRYWKDKKNREKVNITALVQPDETISENEARTLTDVMIDRIGETEVEVEAFRAKAWQIVLDEVVGSKLLGLKIGDEVDGSIIGLDYVKLRIAGGSDATGIPMHPGVPGPVKKKVLLSGPPGFHPREKGERRRKMVRGNVISDGTVKRDKMVQINVAIIYPEEKQ